MINTPSGTVDLRTGDVRDHDRSDFITKMTAVGTEGSYPTWLSFLNRIFNGDQNLIAYVQRVLGYPRRRRMGGPYSECLRAALLIRIRPNGAPASRSRPEGWQRNSVVLRSARQKEGRRRLPDGSRRPSITKEVEAVLITVAMIGTAR
jgi:hypothetical protein